jgi:hypothetical protein
MHVFSNWVHEVVERPRARLKSEEFGDVKIGKSIWDLELEEPIKW